jgi:hypothetical protein
VSLGPHVFPSQHESERRLSTTAKRRGNVCSERLQDSESKGLMIAEV